MPQLTSPPSAPLGAAPAALQRTGPALSRCQAGAPSPAEQMIAIAALAEQGRALLALRGLSKQERQRLLGKWFAAAHDFAGRAAACLSFHGAALAPVIPYGPADIEAQRARVVVLERAQHELQALAKEASDSLLVERARLYEMSSGVLKGLTWLDSQPFLPPPARAALQGSLASLRRELDRKNKKISRSKRQRAQDAR